jgi:pimeloyl-ACP methyl ester carboxylesterase
MSVGLVAVARIASALILVVTLSSAGWAQEPVVAKPRNGVHVYLFRGFTGMFSQGMDEIGGKLRRRGIPASVHAHIAWSSQAAEAIQAYKSGRTRTIVLIGHSMGGPSVINMAEELARAQVPVALIITFDPVGSLAAPPNVRKLVNYYVSGGVGVTVARAQGSRGSVVNTDLSSAGLGHVSVQYSEQMQHKAVSDVLAAIAPPRAPAAPPPAPQAEPEKETGVTATSAAPIAPAVGEPIKQ